MGGTSQQLIPQRGIPIMPAIEELPFTQGNVYHVKPISGSDSNYGDHPESAFKTLSYAHGKATANQNDVVLMYAEHNTVGSTTAYQSSALTWSKNAVHLIGVNSGPMIGQRSRIAPLTTVGTIEDLFTLSANGCLIKNILIFHGDVTSTATAPRAMVISGQRNKIQNCQISGNGDTGGTMDLATARSLVVTGGENFLQHCYLGLDTVLRATQLMEVQVLGTSGAKVTRTVFEDCMFQSWTSLSTFKAFNATYLDRFVMFKNCEFCAAQGISSAVAPTGAISNTTPNGQIWMLGGGVFGYADVVTANDTTILALTYSGLAANVVDQGVAKAIVIA